MKSNSQILIVDDEINIRGALITMLEKRGYGVRGAGSAEAALEVLDGMPIDLVITDLKMSGIGGMELLHRIKEQWPDTEVVVMTAYGSIDTAVEAMRRGAYDYLMKPLERERFPLVVEKALERQALTNENKQLRDRLETRTRFDQMVGESEPMQRVYNLVEMVAGSDVTVLLTGASGTGKELVARAIHHKSTRTNGPFVTLNCGALPENLFESELFGYEKGAYTGAMTTKAGRFELAHGGTLLLDEVGELSLKSQVDFLRVLETKEFRRLGGTKLLRVDTRIIAATNRNLEEAVKEGDFREDLYYRLNVVPIRLPVLRERAEDIPLLVETFLNEFAARHHRDQQSVSREAMQLLRLYAWPGNIRQLRNLMERLVVTVKEGVIQPDHLPEEIRTSKQDQRTMVITLGRSLEDIEREVIRRTLTEVTNHREKAAKVLGISLRTLQYKIKEYGIGGET
jgi:DNA-binding NtrC family response regulator